MHPREQPQDWSDAVGPLGGPVPSTFRRQDFVTYRRRLLRCVDAFAQILDRFEFDEDRPMTGIELEICLVDPDYEPAMRNQELLGILGPLLIAAPLSAQLGSPASARTRSAGKRAARGLAMAPFAAAVMAAALITGPSVGRLVELLRWHRKVVDRAYNNMRAAGLWTNDGILADWVNDDGSYNAEILSNHALIADSPPKASKELPEIIS